MACDHLRSSDTAKTARTTSRIRSIKAMLTPVPMMLRKPISRQASPMAATVWPCAAPLVASGAMSINGIVTVIDSTLSLILFASAQHSRSG
jgi:hypothetical protein